MMKTLKHLRDFMTEEQLKWLPGAFKVENCILLRQNKTNENNMFTIVLQVFDSKGTWIGEITQPDYIPD